MRPRGEIREALAQAAGVLAQRHGGGTWRDIAAAACVGFELGRHTIKNMVRAGELQRVRPIRVEWSRREVDLLAPAAQPRA